MTVRHFPLFHHAFPVSDLDRTRGFYRDLLGCEEGKTSLKTANFEFFGHHIIAHLVEGEAFAVHRKASEGRNAALRHFGVALPWEEWEALRDELVGRGATFLVEPHERHVGEPGEEALMLLTDPSGNVIEFKCYRDIEYLFHKQ